MNKALNEKDLGQEMYRLVETLYPICRSITGNGFRETLSIINQHIPLEVHEVPSGTAAFDWTVPKEWNIKDAYIKNLKGERVVDFRKSNLHVVSYSVPVKGRMALSALKEHLFSLPDHPEWIPYRTSYYKESWGFCLSHRQLLELRDEEYDVCIDATLTPGHLTYGEYLVPGDTAEEVLISCHACHPSLCDDNLSGIAVATFLARQVSALPHRFSYRFLFIPGTIGSITWLSRNDAAVSRIRHGVVLTSVGDAAPFTYKKSRRGDAPIDRAFGHVLKHLGAEHQLIDFFPYGYDERQYCSPGFDLPVGSLMRGRHGQFPEYHTSADNLDFVSPEKLQEAMAACLTAFTVLENNRTYVNQNPKCEPQLGKRGLYTGVGGQTHTQAREMAMLWLLNLSDGNHSLLEIAERAGLPFAAVQAVVNDLREAGLLRELDSVETETGDEAGGTLNKTRGEAGMNLSREKLLSLYQIMALIREFEERLKWLVETGVPVGAVHYYVGQEAIAAGVCGALRSSDWIASTHRGHGHCIAKGVDVRRMMAELYGKVNGTNRGKGGSMHITDVRVGMLGVNPIVGMGTTHAVGAGISAKVRKTDEVAVTFFGEGAASIGAVHESMNMAAIWKLPVIFVCENNGYAQATPVEYAVSVKDIADRAAAYNMPGEVVDGQDVLAVYAAAEKAIKRARAGEGPSLIECKTHRFYGHHQGDDTLRYRTAEEEQAARDRDCLSIFKNHVISNELLTQIELDEIDACNSAAVDDAVAFAQGSPLPQISELYRHVYVE